MIVKFYVVEITKYNDGTKDAYAVYCKDTETEAVALFHQKLAGAMKSEVIAFELCQVINDYGVVVKSEYFERTSEPTNEDE